MTELDDRNYRADLMSGDVVVAHLKSRAVIPVIGERLPLCFRKGGDIVAWLEHRAMDSHRANARPLKDTLRLPEQDDLHTALWVHAATITDNFWIRPANSTLLWDDVKFTSNVYADLALTGTSEGIPQVVSRTPELTNTGSFEKCWRLEDGEWWMYKVGNLQERFSELFVYELCKALGFPTAMYQNSGEFIKTKNFTNENLNFEPAAYLVGDDEDYLTNYEVFSEFGEAIADQYVEIILMDAFCRNVDRHTYNYGLLRERETGKVVSMAPNFDNNIALIARGVSEKPRGCDLLIKLLVDLEKQAGAVSRYLQRNQKPVITPELIAQCCQRTGLPADIPYVQQFVMKGYQEVFRVL